MTALELEADDDEWEDVDDEDDSESGTGSPPADPTSASERAAPVARLLRETSGSTGAGANLGAFLGAGLSMTDNSRWQVMLRNIKDAYEHITPDKVESLADDLLHVLEQQGGSVDGFVSFLEGMVTQDEANARA